MQSPVSPATGELPWVSVVVAGRDRPEKLQKCLTSLRASGYPRLEIIYVDTGSQPEHLDAISHIVATVRFERITSGNPQEGRNLGARLARSDWILFCDDDFCLNPGTIEALVRCAESSERIGVVGFLTGGPGSEDRFSLGDYSTMSPIWLPMTPVGTSLREPIQAYLIRSPGLFRRSVLERTGGWEESFFLMADEVDLLYRICALGYVVAILPQRGGVDLNENRIETHAQPLRLPSGERLPRESLQVRNSLLSMYKNLSMAMLVLLVPPVLLYELWEAAMDPSLHLRTLAEGLRSFFRTMPSYRSKREARLKLGTREEFALMLRLSKVRPLSELSGPPRWAGEEPPLGVTTPHE